MAQAQWEYSLRDAAKLAGVSVDTIKRRLRAGDLPHAHQRDDPAKTWVVPLGDLVAAGFSITPSHSLQAPNSIPNSQRAEVSPMQVRLAVAEAVERVHAEYAQAFAEAAAGSMRFADLATIVGARFGLSGLPAVTALDTIDLTADELGAGPESGIVVEDAARTLLGQLSDRDLHVLAWLGEPLSVVADRTGLPRSTAAFAATRLRQHLEVLLSGEQEADAILMTARTHVRATLGLD